MAICFGRVVASFPVHRVAAVLVLVFGVACAIQKSEMSPGTPTGAAPASDDLDASDDSDDSTASSDDSNTDDSSDTESLTFDENAPKQDWIDNTYNPPADLVKQYKKSSRPQSLKKYGYDESAPEDTGGKEAMPKWVISAQLLQCPH